MSTTNMRNAKLELINWINNLHDSSTLSQIKEIKNTKAGKHNVLHDWWCESKMTREEEHKNEDSYKHIF